MRNCIQELLTRSQAVQKFSDMVHSADQNELKVALIREINDLGGVGGLLLLLKSKRDGTRYMVDEYSEKMEKDPSYDNKYRDALNDVAILNKKIADAQEEFQALRDELARLKKIFTEGEPQAVSVKMYRLLDGRLTASYEEALAVMEAENGK